MSSIQKISDGKREVDSSYRRLLQVLAFMFPVQLHIEMYPLEFGKQLMARNILHQKGSHLSLMSGTSSSKWHKGCIQNTQRYVPVNLVFWMKIDQTMT